MAGREIVLHTVVHTVLTSPPDWWTRAGTLGSVFAVLVALFQIEQERRRRRRDAAAQTRAAGLLTQALTALIGDRVGQLADSAAANPAGAVTAEYAKRLRDDQDFIQLAHNIMRTPAFSLEANAVAQFAAGQLAILYIRHAVMLIAQQGASDEMPSKLREEFKVLEKVFDATHPNIT